ncbi:hypothetical protein [Escherichia coli]|uniref:hypothetical protein n=1 Tax=Escherichia coli TaxID=562 RepID=UPI00388D49F8
MPDPIETLKAAETLVQQGLSPYCGPIRYCVNVWKKSAVQRDAARRADYLNQGLENPRHAGDIIQQATVPVVAEHVGIGVPQPCRAGAGNGGRRGVANTRLPSRTIPSTWRSAFRSGQ